VARTARITFLCLLTCLALTAPAAKADGLDQLLAPESACPGQTDTGQSIRAQVSTMLCMHRYARHEAGVKGIHRVRSLNRSARNKARDIRRCQSFSHTACGRDAFYWFAKVGFLRGSYGVAENLAFGSSQSGDVRMMMDAWLHSPEHRRSLLDSEYRDVGIGMVRGSYQGYGDVQFWVAHFGYHG
jgi:uncharacterized protein YkwD